MKIVLRVLAIAVVVLIGLAAALYGILRPPEPLALPDRGFTLNDVTVINPGTDRAEHRRVTVVEDTVAEIRDADGTAGDPYAGAFVMPGLTDMHVHFPPATLPGQTQLFAFLFLYHGITAVRDAGDVDGSASEPARSGIASGRFPGPRLFSCGPFVGGDPPLWANTLVATNPEEGRRAVETVAQRGYECVKAYEGLDAATLEAVRDAAERAGLPVIGHVPRGVRYDIARLDDAQHLIGVAPPVEDPSIRFPFNLEAWNRLEEHWLDFIIRASLRHDIANTPTLVTIDRLLASQDYARVLEEPELGLLPRFYREVVWNPSGGTSAAGRMQPADFAMVHDAFGVMQRTVLEMKRAGVRIHSGTDSLVAFVVPGASLHRELRLLVAAGFTPEEALAVSMRDSARFLDAALGEVRVGGPAELVVFREDPTLGLDALDSIAAVVRDGRLHSRAALDAQLERERTHFDGALYDAIVTPLVRQVLAATTGS